MAQFVKQAGKGTINAVEFSAVADERYAFFTLAPNADIDAITSLLGKAPANQHILSVTPSATGALVVTRGTSSPAALLSILAEHGQVLTPPAPVKKAFNPWAWRGYSSILGQSLQIASSMKGNGTAADRMAIFGFAALNLTANFINILFGAQKKPDHHQLRLLKQQVNHELSSLVDDDNLPDADFIVHTAHGKSASEHGVHALLQKYSVSFGEIGLRTLGAFSLSFPITKWKAAVGMLRETGSLGTALKEMRNPNPVTFGAGLITLLGKFTSLSAKEPDPYNPEPPSLIERFRQKIAFRLSSIIEGGAAMWMTHDRFTKQKITLGGKEMPDYLGGAGNTVFVGGYGIRLAAPYGTLEVDMPELYAHAAEGLSKVQASDLPTATARIANQLHQHFHASTLTVGDIYSALARELKTKHHLEIKPAPTNPDTHDSQLVNTTPSARIESPRETTTTRVVQPHTQAAHTFA